MPSVTVQRATLSGVTAEALNAWRLECRRRCPVGSGRIGVSWLVGTAIYTSAVCWFFVTGGSHSTAFIVVGYALTLPCGISGLIGVYFIVGLLTGVCQLIGVQVASNAMVCETHSQTTICSEFQPHWFLLLVRTTIVGMFAVCAIMNAVLARKLAHRILARSHAP